RATTHVGPACAAAGLPYTLSLHDALPISGAGGGGGMEPADLVGDPPITVTDNGDGTATISVAVGTGSGQVAAGNHNHNGVYAPRSEEHTSELQSRENLVCRLLLEKKKHTP